MRKDLLFRYLNSCVTNLNRVGIHLLNQENDETRELQEDNRIAKESHPAISEVESNFIESQLESIIKTAQFLLQRIESS